MNFTPEQVDLIVQRVLAQLGPSAVAAPAAAGAHLAAAVAPSPVPAAQVADQVVTGQVITGALLTETVNGFRQVQIGPKAILTPSARDFVKQRGIQIIREATAAAKASAIRWQIIVTRSNPQVTAAVESLPQLGVAASVTLSGLPAEAAAQATSALCRGEAIKVVVFTDQPELLSCLANRNDKVRAAAATNVAVAERIRGSMQANLLAVDPGTRSAHEIKGLLRVFKGH